MHAVRTWLPLENTMQVSLPHGDPSLSMTFEVFMRMSVIWQASQTTLCVGLAVSLSTRKQSRSYR